MLPSLLLTAALLLTPSSPVPVVADRSDPGQTGMQDSYYQGDYLRKSQEPIRKCIGQREGRFQYWGTGSNGWYQGTYQVTEALAVGASWMMRKELREDWGVTVGNEISRALRTTPAHKWNRYYQDMMWFVVVNWRGDGSGLKHWRGGRYGCPS